MKLKAGLCSITFRELSTGEIINLVKKTSLTGIEWGGDIHVPHGNLKKARAVAANCRDAGLEISSYGSYYKAGTDSLSFRAVAETSIELGAPIIRIWPGIIGSRQASSAERGKIIEDLVKCAEIASELGVEVALEKHGGSLTDTSKSIAMLFKELAKTNIKFYWQPEPDSQPKALLSEIQMLLPRLANFHVYYWKTVKKLERFALADGVRGWNMFFESARKVTGTHWALMEFVREDSQKCFLEDATTLTKLII